MKVLFFANKMPDLCGAFLHDIDLALELQKRGHQVVFLTIRIPREGYNGGTYRGFRFVHYTAATSFLDTSEIWLCPHSPVLPTVRKLNARGYNRPIFFTCHYDGSYEAVTTNAGSGWKEMAGFINKMMEPNYRRILPPNVTRTEVIRPIMHREKIVIPEPFQGDSITLINANLNKGLVQFLDLAKRMPDRKFLGVLAYYGELGMPIAPSNVTWVPFDDDVRNILKRTRILLMPSSFESFGRVAVEAMLNGIPVLYALPGGPPPSTDGLHEWIQPAGIGCNRDIVQEWEEAVLRLDDPDTYAERSQQSKEHIETLNLFTEATRIAQLVEAFSRENPVAVRSSAAVLPAQRSAASPQQEAPRIVQPKGPAGFGFSHGRLRLPR
jgi:glycosyltransferase involved in cell wall biosynthesis